MTTGRSSGGKTQPLEENERYVGKWQKDKETFCMFISKNNIKSQKNYMNCLLLKFDKAVILYSNNWN